MRWVVVSVAVVAAAGGSALAGCGSSTVIREELPIEDDFSGGCNWSEDDDRYVSLACTDGQYRMLLKNVAGHPVQLALKRLKTPIRSASVEADVSLRTFTGSGGSAFEVEGIGCWSSGIGQPARGYLFVVSSNQRAASLAREDDTGRTLPKPLAFHVLPLVDKHSQAVAGIGATSTIRAECELRADGVHLAMFVNGHKIAEQTDPVKFGPFEAVGFITISLSNGTDIRFDNFRVDKRH